MSVRRCAPFRAGSIPARTAFAALLAGMVAAGCASLPAPTPGSATLAPRPLAASFTASGRVAARVAASTGGEQARGFSGGFSWVHQPDADTVELMTPLGQLAARLTLTAAGGADIELPDGRRNVAADPERFLEESLGVALPLGALPYWLQAVPMPRVPFRAEADDKGRPSTLWQNGWQIQYTEYASDDVLARPTRLQLNHGDVEARMIVGDWSSL